MGGCCELACDDKSERLDRRLGDGDANTDGRSRDIEAFANGLFELCAEDLCRNSGLAAELDGLLAASRPAKGFEKAANVGLRGLRVFSSTSPNVNKGIKLICQSKILFLSSVTFLNTSIFDVGSLPVKPPDLLDLRFRCLSKAESSLNSRRRVGRTGLCLRCCIVLTSQDRKAEIGC